MLICLFVQYIVVLSHLKMQQIERRMPNDLFCFLNELRTLAFLSLYVTTYVHKFGPRSRLYRYMAVR